MCVFLFSHEMNARGASTRLVDSLRNSMPQAPSDEEGLMTKDVDETFFFVERTLLVLL